MSLPWLSVEDSGRALRPPQFSLRALLLGVAAVAALLGLMVAIGPAGSALCLLLLALAIAHVAGNALGTLLRDGDGRSQPAQAPPPAAPPRCDGAQCFHENTRPGRGALWGLTLGAGGGALLGSLVYAQLIEGITLAGVLVGMLSTAVLGGYVGIMAGTFAGTTRRARREALDEPPAESARPHDRPSLG